MTSTRSTKKLAIDLPRFSQPAIAGVSRFWFVGVEAAPPGNFEALPLNPLLISSLVLLCYKLDSFLRIFR
jgi:hypothetical protein